jgi:peptide chain release factor subunit 3
MYNPYGGMYDNNMMNNYYQQNPQQYQGQFNPQDPNAMYQNYGGYNNYYQNPNGQNNYQGLQQPQQQQPQQTQQQTQNKPALQPQAQKGIAGLPGVKTPVTTNKPQTKPGTASTSNKPGTAQSKTQVTAQAKKPEEKKTSSNTAQTKKEENKQTVSQVKKDDTSEAELSKNLDNQINLNTEQNLVDDSKEGAMIEVDNTRKPVNIIFIGHVDAGKSTISGSILLKTGMIDERTIEKYQRLAKTNNRESWFIAYITDENEEEREKGKTVEVGKAFFNTPTKRYTILDAPGHASYVPNMLLGACQADFAGLVISAKNGEFESGFEGDGRTREHALLAKSLGVTKLVVIINKMDEETVKWSKQRYDQIKNDLSGYLKSCGYNIEKHVYWIPISGLKGENLVTPVDKHTCSWYDGPTLIEILDKLETPERREDAPVRIPVLDRYKDQGIYLLGKIESGIVKYGSTYTIMPSKINFEVGWLFNTEEKGIPYAKPGECIRVFFIIIHR